MIDNARLARVASDPGALELSAHREIVIISGTPPAVLPRYRWPSGT